MSFRLRVLALVALVAVTATAATAWLTLRQASQQLTESATAERETVDFIEAELSEYAQVHGTWEGVPPLVDELRHLTGQRIRLVADSGDVVVDTDHLDGAAARPVGTPALSISPRPVLELPANLLAVLRRLPPDEAPAAVWTEDGGEVASRGPVERLELDRIVLTEIDSYRSGVRFAACLTRSGFVPLVTDGPYGVPRYTPDPYHQPSPPAVETCLASAAGSDQQRHDDAAELAARCPDGEQYAACAQRVFHERAGGYAPEPVLVYVGTAVDAAGPPLSPGPVLMAAAAVAVLAVAGALLVSRRVTRPIRNLTAAAHQLGTGDLSGRVPVAGRDELAGLARSFNRMADSLQRGEERQRRLVADVAHELRTPLANLRGYLEALKDGVISPEPGLFASLHEEAVLQQRVVDDLQELALAEAGTLVYHWSQVDIGELVETCRTAHQATADAAGVRLVAATGPPGSVCVSADPDRLRQVLGNLVANAVRATTAGGTVTLATGQEGTTATVTVTDTGRGIAPAHLPYVFDRFWRADAARGRSTGGSGLGLAIVRQIVTDHGGTIAVASELDTGTTFTIRLPPARDGAVEGQRSQGTDRSSWPRLLNSWRSGIASST